MQQASLNKESSQENFLKKSAFDSLINKSNQILFLLNDQLYIQAMSQQACEIFSVKSQDILHKHLPTWFIEQGWVPPLVCFDAANNRGLKGSCATQIKKDNDVFILSWTLDYFSPTPQREKGLMLQASLDLKEKNRAVTDSSLKAASLFQALHSHLAQSSTLAQQTLVGKEQEVLVYKIAMQNMFQSMEQSQSLLSFAAALEQADENFDATQKTYDLQKSLQSIIEKYQLENTSLDVQITLENKQSIDSKLLRSNKQFETGLSSLISPLLNFLEKGSVRLIVQQKRSANQSSVVHIQLKISGEDAFGFSIQEWISNEAKQCGAHKILYLHWLLGKAWLEKTYGCCQVRCLDSGVHVDMMLPCAFEKVSLKTEILDKQPIFNRQPIEKKQRKVVSLNYEDDLDPLTKKARGPGILNILLIEDNEMNKRVVLQMVHRLFDNIFFKVTGTAQAATEAYQAKNYDMIILDIGLPDNDGLQLAFRLREIEKHKGRSPIPICVLSAHYDRSIYEKECAESDKPHLLQAFYAKPIKPNQIQGMIESFLPNAINKRLAIQA
jgi:CheY-like chemotaxis protein